MQRLLVSGRVQRVGYRDWTVRNARELGLTGWVRNLTDGRVEILAEGDEASLGKLLDALRAGPALQRSNMSRPCRRPRRRRSRASPSA
ncbi:MAG: acylphosphatase [Sphingomonas sp.]|uniref:acylphosphatase n=1 Tax=Sphingomonas sp. TaxID=28214 RepID=UPI00356A68CE